MSILRWKKTADLLMKIDNAVTTMYKEKRIIPYHALVDLINYNKTVKLYMPKYLLLAFCILASISVSAQSKPGSIFGQTKIEKNINGVSISTSIGGVVVEACTVKDTLYTTTVNGVFQLKKVTAGRVVLRFSHISCKDVIKEVEVKLGETTEVEVTMREASQEIESVTVKGEVPVLTVKGDTLVYNAVAVRTFEGDEPIKIVEQLPGVLTSENGVSVMGKDISRTYVDGKLIFGSDPRAALQNLLANDVLKIRVYDEYADDNPHRKRRKGEEMRVCSTSRPRAN